MKLYFKLELFCIRNDYKEDTGYLLVPRKSNTYPAQAAYILEGTYNKFKTPSDVWGQYHKYKKIG